MLLALAACWQIWPFSLPGNKEYAGPCIDAILNCRYETAFAKVDSAAAADPSDPLAPLLRLTVLGIRDVDFDTLLDTADFFRTFRETESLIAAYEKNYGASSYAKMLLGLSKGIHSAFYLRLEAYYSAIQNGFSALDLLDEAHRLDQSNVEPLFLLGLYDYARGELRKKLWWVMFWYPGSKERGIERLWTCNRSGTLTGKASLFALADIYTREKRPAEAGTVMSRLEKEFPASRFMLWEKVKYLELKRMYYEAALAGELLALSYEKHPYGSYNAFVARNLQAHLFVKAGQKKDAARCCRLLLKSPQNKRNKVFYKDTEKLLRSIDGR
jgi:hypothetical protein